MASNFDVDPELVRKLAELLGETGLSEIEYESNGRRIRIARQTGAVLAAPTVAAQTAAAASAAEAPKKASAQTNGTVVTSPMVGTVYLSPEPGAETFVKTGDIVSEGQTILLIEAMKTYNPVRAPRAGKIGQILVSDSTPVEFGEELMVIE